MPLPPGLILNPGTGQIEGTPTVPGLFSFELKVRDVLGTQRVLNEDINIESYDPMVTGPQLVSPMLTRAYSGSVAVTGGRAVIVYSILSGALPGGLSLNTASGAITGTPNVGGAYAFTRRAVDGIGQILDTVFTGTVTANLTLSYAAGNGSVGVAFSKAATTGGGTAPYTYSLQTGALPTGTTLDASTGLISGTPTTPGTYNATIRVTDANGYQTTSAMPSTQIVAQPQLSGALPRTMVGRAYNSSYALSGGLTPFSYSATGLPPGLSINVSTGAITGTVGGSAGNPLVRVTVVDSLGNTTFREQNIEVAAALSLSGTIPSATRAIPFTFSPTRSGGYSPYAFDISAGSLPLGLSLDPATGIISGTPTTQANYTATLRMTDADAQTTTMPVNINVAGDLVLTPGVVTTFDTSGVVYGGFTASASGGQTPYSWSIAAGALPAGLTLNTSTGEITGTASVQTEQVYNATVRLSDSIGQHADYALAITHANFPSLTGSPLDATNGIAYSFQPVRTGGHNAVGYTISAGALPTGLSLNASTGQVTGTPSVNGAASFTIRLTDARGNIANLPCNMTVYSVPAISGAYATEGELSSSTGTGDGTTYGASAGVTGGKSPYNWSLNGALPLGLSFSNGTGAITGIFDYVDHLSDPYRDYPLTSTVTDALGRTAQTSFTIRVYTRLRRGGSPYPGPGFNYPTGVQGVAYNQNKAFSNGKAPIVYSIIGTIPPGLTLNTATSALTGTPTTPGFYSMTLRGTDALGVVVDNTGASMQVGDPVTINGTPPNATQGVAYSFSGWTVAGGTGGYAYDISAGALPAGLSISASTGAITGTPSGTGLSNFTVRATSGGSSGTRATSITVVAQPVFTLNYGHGTVGRAYSGTITGQSGGQAPFSYAVVSGALPGGVSLNSSTGALSGTCSTQGTFNFTIRLTDALGNQVDRAGSIVVANAVAISGTLPAGTNGVAYSSTLNGTGGWPGYTFSVVSGAVPTGTSLSAGGTLSGTPTVNGTYNFTVRATDTDGNIGDSAQSVVISPPPATSVTIFPNPAYASEINYGGGVTVSRSVTASATGGTPPYTYAWTFLSAFGDTGAFTHTGTSTATLGSSRTGPGWYSRTENWRCTVTPASGTPGFADVAITLDIERDA